jgi:SprT protein
MTENPPSEAGLQARIEDAVRDWVAYAHAHLGFGRRPLPVPEVRLDLRGRGAGLAVISPRKRQPDLIRLNATLLREHPREMIEETVPHEVAHVVAYRLFGRRIKPHGREWQDVMRAFGKDPSVSHCMPAEPTRRLRRFAYRCGCESPVELTSIRHRRVQQGAVYRCRRCGERLIFSGESA